MPDPGRSDLVRLTVFDMPGVGEMRPRPSSVVRSLRHVAHHQHARGLAVLSPGPVSHRRPTSLDLSRYRTLANQLVGPRPEPKGCEQEECPEWRGRCDTGGYVRRPASGEITPRGDDRSGARGEANRIPCQFSSRPTTGAKGVVTHGVSVRIPRLISPRLLFGLIWIFSDRVPMAFEHVWMAMVGLLFLPWTALVYTLAYAPEAASARRAGPLCSLLSSSTSIRTSGAPRHGRMRWPDRNAGQMSLRLTDMTGRRQHPVRSD